MLVLAEGACDDRTDHDCDAAASGQRLRQRVPAGFWRCNAKQHVSGNGSCTTWAASGSRRQHGSNHHKRRRAQARPQAQSSAQPQPNRLPLPDTPASEPPDGVAAGGPKADIGAWEPNTLTTGDICAKLIPLGTTGAEDITL